MSFIKIKNYLKPYLISYTLVIEIAECPVLFKTICISLLRKKICKAYVKRAQETLTIVYPYKMYLLSFTYIFF